MGLSLRRDWVYNVVQDLVDKASDLLVLQLDKVFDLLVPRLSSPHSTASFLRGHVVPTSLIFKTAEGG